MSVARWIRGLGALVVALWLALMVGTAGVYWLLLRCDERCGRGSGWRADPDAWQWHAQLGLGAAAVGAMLLGSALLFRREPGCGWAIFGAGVTAAVAWAVWLF